MNLKHLLSLITVPLLISQSFALKVGVTAGPHAMILEKVKEEAKKEGLAIEIIEFNDFIMPNRALKEGDLKVNSFQHEPYLKNQIESQGYQFVSVCKTVVMPMGIYASSLKNINDLKESGKVGIPNDPSNGARALQLLATAGLLKLREGIEIPSVLDIVENPKKLEIVELEAPQVLKSLDDLACAVINTDWVVLAKKDPQSALLQENKNSPYANVIAVRESDKNDPEVEKLVKIYQSGPIRKYIETEFKGAVIPAF
jgi:D-methionine transport system substrate-binding protein